jgi:hypothetical protein
MLFPIKSLPYRSKISIIQNQKDPVTFESVADHLFLCCDHFTAKENKKSELCLRSDLVFNYSLEYIFEVLNTGIAEIKLGRKSWRSQPCLPYLISRAKSEPPFADLIPITEFDKAELRRTLERMAETGLFTNDANSLFSSQYLFSKDYAQ